MAGKKLSAESVLRDPDAQKRPGLILGLLESRAIWECGAYFATLPLHRFMPTGDAHPVMVLPGFASGDGATVLLRHFLKKLGYQTYAWNAGFNMGHKPGLFKHLHNRIDTIQGKYGRKVSLVGWSLGGIMSRKLAFQRPEMIRSVITLGSPFYGANNSTNISALLEFTAKLRKREVLKDPEPVTPWLNEPAVPVPFSSLYSRSDGVVTWKTCLEADYPLRENIHVPSSHMAFGFNPLSLYVIADRLAQPEGEFTPFEPGPILDLILR